MTLSIATPTATLIGYQENDPHSILVIEPAGSNKLNLLSGKVDLASKESYQAAIQREFNKKCGSQGATLKHLKPFAVAIDPYRDVRSVALYSLQPAASLGEQDNLLVNDHYGTPEFIFFAQVQGVPVPQDSRTLLCSFIDTRLIQIEKFSRGHDVIFMAYQHYLATGKTVPILDDFTRLRRDLGGYEVV